MLNRRFEKSSLQGTLSSGVAIELSIEVCCSAMISPNIPSVSAAYQNAGVSQTLSETVGQENDPMVAAADRAHWIAISVLEV